MPKPPIAPRLTYTQTPNVLFDDWLQPGLLTEAELRVVLYICRHTFGWNKASDAISLKQLTGGITRRDGTRVDWGAGVQRAAAARAIKSLESKGLIRIERGRSAEQGDETNVYSLVIEGEYLKETPGVSLENPDPILKIQPPVSLEYPQNNGSKDNSKEDNRRSGLIWQTAADHALVLKLSNPLGVPGRACDLWRASGLSEAAFVARLEQAAAAAAKARGDKAAAYWAVVEQG